MTFSVDQIKYDAQGLVPAIVQDAVSKEVLMLAYMNSESLQRTIQTGDTWFWSRSRQELVEQRGNFRSYAKGKITALRLRCRYAACSRGTSGTCLPQWYLHVLHS